MMKKTIAILMIAVSLTLFSAEKYAVLIAGDYEATGVPSSSMWNTGTDLPNTEFWNDLFLQWEMLYKSGYKTENIKVLFAKGVDLYNEEGYDWVDIRYKPENYPGFNSITNYAATEASVAAVCADLGSKMEYGEDFLYVWVMSHSNSGSIYLMNDGLNGNVGIPYDRLANYFKPLNALNKVYLLSINYAENLSTSLQEPNTTFLNSKESFGTVTKNK